MKIFLAIVSLLLMPALASALVISEVMHSPSQGKDTNAEWIELYNDEEKSIDLSLWKIDGSNFDDYVIMPGEYLVIARKLIGGNESFESIWGNNDGIWDESDGFSAIDGIFSLTTIDAINLSNENKSVIAAYDASLFNNKGATAILVNATYIEGTANGTPGYPEHSEDEIAYSYISENVLPKIVSIYIEDDYNQTGFQINSPLMSIDIEIIVNATDDNGDELEIYIEFLNVTKKLDFRNDSYFGKITILPDIDTFNITVNVNDGFGSIEEKVKLEIIKKKSYSLSKNAIRFSKTNNGGISTASFKIKNNGDILTSYYLKAEGRGNTPEIFLNQNWIKLSNEIELPALNPGEEYEIILRIKSTPVKRGKYYGKLKVRA